MRAIESVRAVFPEAQEWAVGIGTLPSPLEAVYVAGWLAVRRGAGWIAAYEQEGTWYAPLPKDVRSGGSHTSFARHITDLQTPTYRTALRALQSVLGEP